MTSTREHSDPAVVTPGNHDGVHLGHRALLAAARAHAKPRGLAVRAMTFDPHPTAVLAPERAPIPLTTLARRKELLLRAGADQVHVQRFDLAFANQSPEEFLEALWEQGARAVVVGPDFRFGKGRAGDLEVLRAWGGRRGVDVLVEEPVELDGERVSSSVIRTAVAAGDVERAARLLARVHEVEGDVQGGYRRGRRIGFPTANLDPDPVLLPADGVYAVAARVIPKAGDARDTPAELLPGVVNLGVRPTFEAGRALEVHLLDFDGDLYGRRLRIGFAARLRGEQRFDGVEALKRQIAVDCEAARDTLGDLSAASLSWI